MKDDGAVLGVEDSQKMFVSNKIYFALAKKLAFLEKR